MANELTIPQQRSAAMAAFKQEFDLRRDMFQAFLPSTVTFEKFRSTVMAALQTKPDLLDCTKQSLVKASIEAAELGLSLNPSLREGDILKVWNSKIRAPEAQFRPRYGGLMKLARQSGEVRTIEAHVVREGDLFEYEYGLNPKLVHRPAGSTGEVTHAYCVWQIATGEKAFEVLDREELETSRKRSSSKNKEGQVVGPWVTDYAEMARKTAVRRASKYMPSSAESFHRAVAMDNLREAGHEVELQDGEVVDITGDDGGGEPEQVVREEMVRGKQQQQMAALEQRVTQPVPQSAAPEPAQAAASAPAAAPRQRRQAAPPPMAVVHVPKIDDEEGPYDDIQGWTNACRAALANVPQGRMQDWYAANREVIDEVAFDNPDAAAEVRRLCGAAG